MTIYKQFHLLWPKSHVDMFGSFHVIDEFKKTTFHFIYIIKNIFFSNYIIVFYIVLARTY